MKRFCLFFLLIGVVFAQGHSKPHLILHFDMNQTLIATDEAGQKSVHDVISAKIADRVIDYWDDTVSFPMSYSNYVKSFSLPNPNHSQEIKLKQKDRISKILTLLKEKNHPAHSQMQALYDRAMEHLKRQKTQVFPSFYKLIEFLQKEGISYTLIIRTFGSEGSEVANELNAHFGQGFIKEGSLNEIISGHHLVVRDDWKRWFEHDQHWEYGKPFPIDLNDPAHLSLFFDDHAEINPLFPEENIVFPYDSKSHLPIHPKILIEQNRLFPVETLDAICDEDYYIRSVKKAME